MTLTALTLPEPDESLPEAVDRFVAEARQRIDRFFLRRSQEPVMAFVPSDFVAAYHALVHIRQSHLIAGNAFCEWGCGFGVVAGLASMLEFDACGIEIDEELFREAQQLAADFQVPLDLARGTFIPENGEQFTDELDELGWLRMAGADAYAELDMRVDDFDLIFVYPWPGEERFVEDLFDEFASVGALLLSYHGVEELRLHRKTG